MALPSSDVRVEPAAAAASHGPPAQHPYMVGPAPRKPMSIWWPMGFLIAWIAMSALGGGLIGGGFMQREENLVCEGYYTHYCYYGIDEGLFWGGVACMCIGGLCAITFWALLIVYLVRRSRARYASQATVLYVQHNPTGMNAETGVSPYTLVPQQQPQQRTSQAQPASTLQRSFAPPSHDPSSPAEKNEGKACATCGIHATTPFCPQCGGQMQKHLHRTDLET